jgi:ComF family protein
VATERWPLDGLVGRLQNLLFPARCPGCGMRGGQICDACATQISWLGPDACPRCAAPRHAGWICPSCQGDRPALDGARAACHFDGLVRQLVHELKYRGSRVRAPLLADLLAQSIEARPLALDLLVPVPLSARRSRDRGFNQAELIARALGRRLGVPVDGACLERTRHTAPQVGQTQDQRLTNLEGAFTCSMPEHVRGRRVGIVDDVMTTGATLRGCADVLRAAGAARVFGLVVARSASEILPAIGRSGPRTP